jgi:cystathionine beta-lyase/cystathionine gamma-synthase
MVEFLKAHQQVERVLYPLDPDFPQYELARKQMSGCGGLVTVFLKAEDITSVIQFIDALKRFEIAVSWGGYESLVIPIAAFYGLEGREDPALPWNCVRFYFGLESAEDLIEDLEQAFEKLG